MSAQATVSDIYHTDFALNIKVDDPDFNRGIFEVVQKIDEYKLSDISIKVVALPASDNAAYDGGGLIYIPRQMQLTNQYGSDPVFKSRFDIDAVFAHEYGHAVFDEYLRTHFVEYSDISQIYKDISNLDLKKLTEKLTDQEKKDLTVTTSDLNKKILDNPELLRLYNIILPYNELFADTIAVYYADYKSAIFQALLNPNLRPDQKAEYDYVLVRDFATAHDVTNWSNTSPHGLFGPVRSVLGQDTCWPKTLQQKSKNLESLLELIVNEIKIKYFSKSSVTVADNLTLIKNLQKICNK